MGENAFYDCTNLVTVNFNAKNCASILTDAFRNCYQLTTFIFGDKVETIPAYALSRLNTITSIDIPESVTSIGEFAFAGCEGLTTVNFNAIHCTTMGSIDNPAFIDCYNLTDLTIGSQVETIPAYAFGYCHNLSNINVSEENSNYTSEDGVLFNKAKTELVYFPVGRSYGEYTIPESVTGLGDYAFLNCNLDVIYSPSEVPPLASETTFSNVSGYTIIYVPAGFAEAYLAAEGWKDLMIQEERTTFYVTVYSYPLYGGEITGISEEYSLGEEAVITAQANEGYTFSYWEDINSGDVVSSDAECRFEITGDHDLLAIFEPIANANEDIQISVQANSAVISWTSIEDVEGYALAIFSDEEYREEIADVEFDVDGNIIEELEDIEETDELRSSHKELSYEITDLDPETVYYYLWGAFNEDDLLIISGGNFTTASVGIDPIAGEELRIVPNLVKNDFRISGLSEETFISLSDVDGKMILQQTIIPEETISVGYLPGGIYFVTVKGKTIKIIKE